MTRQTNGSGAAPGGQPEPASAGDEREYQELWFSLARQDWGSLVLVPSGPGGSTARLARALAEVGKRLVDTPVTAVVVDRLEYGTAVALAGLPRFVDRKRLGPEGRWPTVEAGSAPAAVAAEPQPAPVEELTELPAPGDEAEAVVVSSAARLIIAIPPVITEPLGLATTSGADLVMICVELGRTRLEDARRTLQLIGRERVSGCLLLH